VLRIHRLFTVIFVTLLATAPAFASDVGGLASYPEIFGTHETYSREIDRFYKWTGMLQRWSTARHGAGAPCAPGQSERCVPREWQRIVDLLRPLDIKAKLQAVNALINRYPYIPSETNWHEENYWETPFEFLTRSGQCQDYAITKFMLLRAAGVDNDLLRVVVLHDARLNLDHAVVVAYVAGEALLLDNQIPDVVPVDSVPLYQPYYSINESGWWLHTPNPLRITSASLR